MGLNTVETYVAWNAHAPRPGEFRLDGGLDLGRFLDLVAAEGMFAIVRPGPYICAELTNGGLPGWLRAAGVTAVRSSDPAFMTAVRGYLGTARARRSSRARSTRAARSSWSRSRTSTGPTAATGQYLSELAGLIRESGITVPLNTVDQPVGDMLANGALPGVLATGSFGGHVAERLAALRAHQGDGPLMCSEFWHGWFDDWGGHHHVTPVTEAAGNLDEMLRAGASVNIYMFHGGTNFGLTNGANDKGTYQPITTSYDYDAPLDEAGNPTAKYWAFRDVIARHADVSADVPAAAAPPAPSFTVPLRQALPLWDALDLLGQATAHDAVVTADEVGQYQGLTAVRDRSRDAPTAKPRCSRSARSGTGPRSSSTGWASASSPATITTRRWRCPPAPAAAWRSWSKTRAGWTTAPASARPRGSSARCPSAAPSCAAGACGRCPWRTSRRSREALRGRPEQIARRHGAGRTRLRAGRFRPCRGGRPVPVDGGLGQGDRLGQRLLPGPVLVTRTAADALRARSRHPAGRQRADHSRAARGQRGGCLPPRSRPGPY